MIGFLQASNLRKMLQSKIVMVASCLQDSCLAGLQYFVHFVSPLAHSYWQLGSMGGRVTTFRSCVLIR